MPTYKLFAPLINTSGNFPALNLPKPFKIERWSRARILKLWCSLADLPRHEIQLQAESSQCLSENARYGHIVSAEIQAADVAAETAWHEVHEQFDRYYKILKQRFRLISFYLSADVEPIVCFWYKEAQGNPQFESGIGMGEPRFPLKGHVAKHNIEALNAFSATTTLPLGSEYIHLAFEHWEESIRATRQDFQLLSLVMAFEALFNVGAQDIRYRVSRSAAVLLGRNPEQSDRIFDLVSKAYEVRSKLVHTGRAKGLEKIWLHGLRMDVRDAILECQRLQLPKDELSRQLTRLGFGDRADLQSSV